MSGKPDSPLLLTKEQARALDNPADLEQRSPAFRWVMHLGLPVAISLTLHVSLLGILALKTWRVLAERGLSAGEFAAGIVDSSAQRAGGAFKWPGEQSLDLPAEKSAQQIDLFRDLRDLRVSDLTDPANPNAPATEAGGGFGLGELGRGGILGIGSGAAETGGGGIGGGFGSRRQIGQAGVWDLSVAANKICYVIDFSGSVIVAVDDLKRELKRSVGQLRPVQSFSVIIFYSEGAGAQERFKTEAFKPALVSATPEIKKEFFDWIQQKAPMGSTEPLVAMKRALALQPEVVFFFSDGYFDEPVVDDITRSNRAVKAHIHCLVFDEILLQDTSGLPRTTDGGRRLQRVAEANAGKMKVVTGLDLGRR